MGSIEKKRLFVSYAYACAQKSFRLLYLRQCARVGLFPI